MFDKTAMTTPVANSNSFNALSPIALGRLAHLDRVSMVSKSTASSIRSVPDRTLSASRDGENTMSAVTYDHFGDLDVLTLTETVRTDTLPTESVEVAMHASSINTIDVRAREGLLAPLVSKKFPKTPGADLSGVVTRVGARVTTLKVGDVVFGATDPFKGGAFADRVIAPVSQLAKKPAALSHAEAATLPIAGLAALYSVRELGDIKSGQRVLIFGASGAVGLFAIQLAKAAGAHVTTVTGPQGAVAARSFGADVAIDYRAGPIRLKGPFDLIL